MQKNYLYPKWFYKKSSYGYTKDKNKNVMGFGTWQHIKNYLFTFFKKQ